MAAGIGAASVALAVIIATTGFANSPPPLVAFAAGHRPTPSPASNMQGEAADKLVEAGSARLEHRSAAEAATSLDAELGAARVQRDDDHADGSPPAPPPTTEPPPR